MRKYESGACQGESGAPVLTIATADTFRTAELGPTTHVVCRSSRDVKDTAQVVAKLPECIGKVAVLGYCLGGLMTFLTAARYGVDAAAVYHGGDTEKYLGESTGLMRRY